jgi:hypothetical protein
MTDLGILLPDADVWLRAFSRHDPDPLVVHRFAREAKARRIVLVGWVRQTLLARSRDDRQFSRLAWILSAWPDLNVCAADHEAAATTTRRLRGMGVPVAPWQALLWAAANRLGGAVWSRDASWIALVRHGCPLAH